MTPAPALAWAIKSPDSKSYLVLVDCTKERAEEERDWKNRVLRRTDYDCVRVQITEVQE